MAQTRRVYLRRNDGTLGGKPSSGLESQYLLSGFLRCGVCTGNLIVQKKTGQRGRPQLVWICTNRKHRGAEACSAKYGVGVSALTDAVLAQLKQSFLNPVVLGQELMNEWKAQEAAPLALAQERRETVAQIAGLDTELTRLVEAVASGLAPAVLVEAIRTREAARVGAQAKLERLDAVAAEAAETFDVGAWVEETRALMEDLRFTLESDPAAGRQMLRRVLVGPITVTPTGDDQGRRSYTFAGRAGFAQLIGWAPEDRPVDLALGLPWHRVEYAVAGQVGDRSPSLPSMMCPRGDSNTRHAV
jgi:hypothetical protein